MPKEEIVHRRSGGPHESVDPPELSSIELTTVTSIDDGASSDDFEEHLRDSLLHADKESNRSKEAEGFKDDGHGSLPPGSASKSQVVVNIVISFVGAGILGIPYAMKQAGWLLGSVTLLIIAALNLYAMLLLPKIKTAVMSGRYHFKEEIVHSYGDVGRCIMGPRGETFVNLCLGISQAGFATAYVIFIAANMHNLFGVERGLVCVICVPGLFGLVQFRSMAQLSPFSLLANVSNFMALSAVLFQDFEAYKPHNDTIHPVKWEGFLYVVAITIYSMEGVGLILSLQTSAADKGSFTGIMRIVLACISLFMAFFGTMGYWAFGDDTEAPITLNLAGHWSSTFVKVALCLGLYLTYPVMMFPIWTISETLYPQLSEQVILRVCFRGFLVLVSVSVAWMVPNFGEFLSLVGSSICNILGFILPCYFHLRVFRDESSYLQIGLNYFLMIGGIIFGIFGTFTSFKAMLEGEE